MTLAILLFKNYVWLKCVYITFLIVEEIKKITYNKSRGIKAHMLIMIINSMKITYFSYVIIRHLLLQLIKQLVQKALDVNFVYCLFK